MNSQRPSQAILHLNIDADDIIHPGPIDDSVLSQQRTHRTDAIWNPQFDPKGKAKILLKVHKGGALTLDARLLPYVVAVGFYPWTQVYDVKADPSLLTAVVERWRAETHTFHFNDGEATITLQDVSLLTGLHVEGEPVTGKSQLDFNEILVDADEETLKKYARVYLLNLIGLTLFTDKSGKTISIYFLPLLEDLDMEMDWAQKLDRGTSREFVAVSRCDTEDAARRFHLEIYGFRQGIPPNAIESSDGCYGMERKKNKDWDVFHSSYIALWYTRQERLLDGDMAYPGDKVDDDSGGEEAHDTHVEEQMDNRYRTSSSS
ncbi:hypothetical protein QQ045_032452 [Rhodiola kirilowii]